MSLMAITDTGHPPNAGPITMTIAAGDAAHTVQVLTLDVHPAPVVFARSDRATKPDPQWRYVDTAGHEHRAGADRRDPLPTLTPLHARTRCDHTCGDPDCDGYTITLWVCTECRAWVTPRWVPDWRARDVGDPITVGPPTADVDTIGPPPPVDLDDARVTIRRGDATITGRAILDGVRRQSSYPETMSRWSVVLDGPGEPGARP